MIHHIVNIKLKGNTDQKYYRNYPLELFARKIDSSQIHYFHFRETASEQYFLKTVKDLGNRITNNNSNNSAAVSTDDKLTDLKLMCNDGVVHCHQAILASHSFFIRSLLLRNHVLEFGSNIDWMEASAYLVDRRKPDHDATIIINDFDCDTISRMLSCFYTGRMLSMDKIRIRKFCIYRA